MRNVICDPRDTARPKNEPEHPLAGSKFTSQERAAYDWLHARGIRPWVVDLVTKEVKTPNKTFTSLTDYAKTKGWHEK